MTLWTVAHQAPLSMAFCQARISWSGLSFPSLGESSHPQIETASPALQADTLLAEPPVKHKVIGVETSILNAGKLLIVWNCLFLSTFNDVTGIIQLTVSPSLFFSLHLSINVH